MTEEQATLNHVHAVIDEMEPAQRHTVYRLAQQLRDVVNSGGGLGKMALALVGAEEAAA